MKNLPEIGFLRLNQVLKIIPVSASKWWDGVSKGEYPQPIKISTGITAWRKADIIKLCEDIEQVNAVR
jgi:prophage regulatory protein